MDKLSVIRTIILIIAMVNNGLALSGKSPLPFSNEDVDNTVSFIFTLIAAVWAWWKNNYISQRGQLQKETLKRARLYKP